MFAFWPSDLEGVLAIAEHQTRSLLGVIGFVKELARKERGNAVVHKH